MAEPVDLLVRHAHLFTMSGPGVGYVADGAVAVRGSQTYLKELGYLDEQLLAVHLTEPVRNTVPNLVYAGSGHEVKTVIVAGKMLVGDRSVLTADEDAIRAEAQVRSEAVARCVMADPVHKEMALLEAMEAGRL